VHKLVLKYNPIIRIETIKCIWACAKNLGGAPEIWGAQVIWGCTSNLRGALSNLCIVHKDDLCIITKPVSDLEMRFSLGNKLELKWGYVEKLTLVSDFLLGGLMQFRSLRKFYWITVVDPEPQFIH
jgi:hypothetical protein